MTIKHGRSRRILGSPKDPSDTFSPLSLPGLRVWYDFSDESTVTLNGSDISQVDDKSGNASHGVQGTASEQPEYATNVATGLKVAKVNTTEGLEITNDSVYSDDISMYVVLMTTNTNAAMYYIGSVAALSAYGLHTNQDPDQQVIAVEGTFSAADDINVTSGQLYHLHTTAEETGGNREVEFFRDNTSVDTMTNSDTSDMTIDTVNGLLGSHVLGLIGEIGEVVLTDQVSTADERLAMHNYFSRWLV